MSNTLTIFPLELILLTIVLIIIPTFIAILLRRSLYLNLIDSANKVSRLFVNGSRGKQPAIVNKLEFRFKTASQKLEQVNTIALIDGLYSQEELNFLGITLRYEQWDYFCQTLPTLLLAFGLLGTFIGISFNLYNLSETVSKTIERTAATDIENFSYLILQLQKPLQSMGIAFFTSLIAIACSAILIIVNSRYNTNFAKSLLISSLEDYLDNIFKIKVDGYSRLDKAVDRMVKQQEEFLNRFHEKVGQVLETTIGNAANQMVAANQGFQNNVDSMVSRFNDISSSMAASTDSFQESTHSLNNQIRTVTKIVPKFETAANKIESSSNLYLHGAEKIEASKFSENLESLTLDLANTQKSLSQSTAFLGNQVHQMTKNYRQATELAEQIYTQLQTASSKLQDSAVGFIEAAETFKESDFANKLTTATQELTTIPQQFNQSTAILHQSTDALGRAIDNINISTEETNSLIEQVNNLNQRSSKLLESSDRNLQQEIIGFKKITAELNRLVDALDKHKEQVNLGLSDFGGRILKSFERQTNNNVIELQKLTSGINSNLDSLQQTKAETAKLITILKTYLDNFNRIQSELSKLADVSDERAKQASASLNKLEANSDRLINSFQQNSKNNIKEFQKSIEQLDYIASEIKNLIKAIVKHEHEMNSKFDRIGNDVIGKADRQLKELGEKFNKLF